MRASLHADGGARGNPGPAGIGVVLRDENGDIAGEIARGIGHATNNVAEYKALIAGLELALDGGVSHIDVFMDSRLVVHQVKGLWKIKNESLRPLAVRARALLDRFDSAALTQVDRSQNSDADKLANQGMDSAAISDVSVPQQSSLME
ncbi:MAG: ribonuclease HI family protein [Actinobacteria bacterium]|nr:ribonuclease HI family protein [Actinomycetota bacterium]